MKPINFDWEEGTATIEWLAPNVGLIRFMYPEPNELPFRGVCDVVVKDGIYEFKGMVFRASDDAPTLAEHRAVKSYLSSLGYQGYSRRLKNGKVVVKQYGNFAKTQTVEKLNMAQSKLQIVMNYINSDGVVATDITANFNVMSEEQIVNTQEAFANTLVGLGKANVAAQAAAAA